VCYNIAVPEYREGCAMLDLCQSTGKKGLCQICARVQQRRGYVRSVPEYRGRANVRSVSEHREGGAVSDLCQSTAKEGLCKICTRVQGRRGYVRSVPEYREGEAMLDLYQSTGEGLC
jgi:hypothetical protein